MKKSYVITILLILLVSAVLRGVLVPAQLPFHYQSDEYQVIERALRIGTGELNPGLFTWPGTLIIYLNFFAFAIYFVFQIAIGIVGSKAELARLYWVNPAPFYIISRMISVCFGVLMVYSVSDVARSLTFPKNRKAFAFAGVIAAFSAAIMPELIIDSAFGLPDIAAASIAVTALAIAIRYNITPKRKTAIAAGIVLGLAVVCKYNAGLILPGIVVAIFTADSRLIKDKTIDTTLALIAIPISFIVACPFVILDFPTFFNDFTMIFHRQGMARWAPDISFFFNYTLRLGMSWAFIILGGLSIIGLFVRKNKIPAAILLSSIVLLLVAAVPRPLPPRHLMLLYPILAIGIGLLFSYAIEKIEKSLPRLGTMIALSFFVAMSIAVLHDVKGYMISAYRTDSRTEALHYIEDTIPEGSAILIEGIEPDIIAPPIWSDMASLQRLLKQQRIAGKVSGGRYGYLLRDEEYPFGKTTYNTYHVEFGLPAPGEIDYAILIEPDDERFFAEQAKYPGTILTDWDSEYKAYLRDNGELLDTFSGADRPGPTIYIYEIK